MLALICAESPLDDELRTTALFRSNVTRQQCFSAAEAQEAARRLKPTILVVDRDLPGAVGLVQELREAPDTRGLSVVALARGEFMATELALLEAGANAVLRLPPGPDWDDRLFRLMNVPVRRETRVNVRFELDSGFGSSGRRFSALGLNLSVNGLLLDTEKALRVGDDLRLVLELPDRSGPISGTGTVVRQAATPNQYGVELTHVEGDGRQRLKRWVEGL